MADDSGESGIAPASEISVVNRCARRNELLVMADEETVVSPCGTFFIRISISK
jgi:hypothetical protein|tara:strand:- start:247 stop:405 length:159 start_codon:yes stop_codon:yes gene_type:complete